MRILWFSWKDIGHPEAGGAELLTHNILTRAAQHGHEVTLVCSGYKNAPHESQSDGYTTIRVGNRWTVYYRAWRLYLSRFNSWPDVVIDECNTIPFFCRWYARQPVFMHFNQLCREIWFYQMPFPFSLLGFCLEPFYLRALSGANVITISQSTKRDLQRFGFREDRISIIPMGIKESESLPAPPQELGTVRHDPALLILGAVRPMKRTMHALRAFEIAKQSIPELRLVIAGSLVGSYGQKVRRAVNESFARDSVELTGWVDESRRISLMRASDLLLVCSVKEGWCLAVTEANRERLIAVVYDVDGLRDSVKHGITGYLVEKSDATCMAKQIVSHLQTSCHSRQEISKRALDASRACDFDLTYRAYAQALRLSSEQAYVPTANTAG